MFRRHFLKALAAMSLLPRSRRAVKETIPPATKGEPTRWHEDMLEQCGPVHYVSRLWPGDILFFPKKGASALVHNVDRQNNRVTLRWIKQGEADDDEWGKSSAYYVGSVLPCFSRADLDK